jgi:hypothetical protein
MDLEIIVHIPHQPPQAFDEAHPLDESQLTAKTLLRRIPAETVHDISEPRLVSLSIRSLQPQFRAEKWEQMTIIRV